MLVCDKGTNCVVVIHNYCFYTIFFQQVCIKKIVVKRFIDPITYEAMLLLIIITFLLFHTNQANQWQGQGQQQQQQQQT